MKEFTDAIVVGAGAGGGVIAKELSCAGMKTVVFERGDWPNYEDSPNDELINQRMHIIRALHGPDRRKSPTVTERNGKISVSEIDSTNYSIIAACVGSGTVTYGAMGWRFMEQDFKLKSLYGEIENSSLEDWPISYADLEPFYCKAEYEIGVSGDYSQNPNSGFRSRPFPMPAFEYNKESELLANTCKKMGLHPFSIPMLRNSVAYNGRAACIRNRTCCGYVCPVDAKNGTHNTVIPVAIKSGNCQVRTNCMVVKIIMEGKKARGVVYYDDKMNLKEIYADVIVLSASASETARLMFNTKTPDFPNGVGNQNDVLGRNMQGHAYTGARGLFSEDVLELNGPGATMAISDFNHNPKEGIIGGALCTEFYVLPYGFSRQHPEGSRWGLEHKKIQRDYYRKLIRLHGPVQDVPTWGSRVMIEESVKDFWGMPVAKYTGTRHPRDYEHCKFLSAKAAEILKEAGAKKIWQNVGGQGGPISGQHQCGTCRMGNDPKKSVVDKNCKVWDVENLYVGDGSVMVTSGGFNPVLTIMALAYRTGEHIAKTYSKKA